MSRLDTLVEKVILSEWPGLLLDGSIVSLLWEQFLVNYFSPGIIIRGWMDAAMGHFRQEQSSALAALVVDGDIEATRERIKLRITAGDGRKSSTTRVSAVHDDDSAMEVLMQWRRWALGLKCMVAAASVAGLTNGKKNNNKDNDNDIYYNKIVKYICRNI